MTRITGTLHEDVFTFVIIYCQILLKIINVSGNVAEKIKTLILCPITFSGNGAVFKIMWKSVAEPHRSQMTISYGTCALHAG